MAASDFAERNQGTEDKPVKQLLACFLAGLAVVAGGIVVSDLCGDLLNGMPYGSAVNRGRGMYLCVVLITCTGVIVLHPDRGGKT